MKKLINLGIDIGAALLVIGIISFFLVGGPKDGNPTVATSEITTVTLTEATTAATTTTTIATTVATTVATTEETTTVKNTETKAETTIELKKETTTKKESVTATAAPNARAKSGSKYTDEEIYLFAQIIYCEAGAESKAEMARVGQVVLNRMNTDYWEFEDVDTFYEVVTQKGQYPETWAKIKDGIVPSKAAMEVAKGLINGTIDSGLSDDVYWQTGFVPTWNAKVVFKSKIRSGYHYYSVLAD